MYMKMRVVFLIMLLGISAVLAAGCVTPAEPVNPVEPLNYTTAIVGDWMGDKTHKTGNGTEFHIIYHFNDNNMGTMTADVNGNTLSTVEIGWGYLEDDKYIVGYLLQSTADTLRISKDGKTLTNDDGEKFRKL